MLTIFIMPKISVWPEAISAYTPAVSTPRMTPWINACTVSPGPVRLGRFGGSLGDRQGVDRQQFALLPLHEVELAVGRAVGGPGQVPKQGRPTPGVQRADDGRVVDLVRPRRHRRD